MTKKLQGLKGVEGGCNERDGCARMLREMATSTRQLVVVREQERQASTYCSLFGWTLAAGKFRHSHYSRLPPMITDALYTRYSLISDRVLDFPSWFAVKLRVYPIPVSRKNREKPIGILPY